MANDELLAQGQAVKLAARHVALSSDTTRIAVLKNVATQLRARSLEILECNAAEVSAYHDHGPGRDRLQLSESRIEAMARALEEIAEIADPLYESLNSQMRPNGLEVEQIRVPLGVVGVIYENRPNVTTDVAGLCIRSGNAAFLRGSSSAQRTNQLLVDIWHDALRAAGIDEAAVSLVSDTSHEAASSFMGLVGIIDCLIPRGGPSLIAAMRESAKVPYVLDGEGNCHVYVDRDADLEMAAAIIRNAKTSRPGVCNAAETLLVHADVAGVFLPRLPEIMPEVELIVDAAAREYLPNTTLATESDFAKEFLDLVLTVAVVPSIDAAIAHVARFGTGHSEAIVTQSDAAAQRWVREVDAAAVLVNASTRFVDGGELGLGGEVGISTQKLHARGPMGVKELTCLKWVIKGKGQIR